MPIDDVATPPDDWATLLGGGGSADAFTGIIHEPPDTTIFTTGGSKDNNDTDEWRWTNGSVPDKDDLLDGFAALYGDVMYFGADRYANNGDGAIGFWFFQAGIATLSNGGFTPVAHRRRPVRRQPLQERWRRGPDHPLSNGSAPAAPTAPSTCSVRASSAPSRPSRTRPAAIANETATAAPWPYTPKAGAAGHLPAVQLLRGRRRPRPGLRRQRAVLLQLPDRDPLVRGGQRPAQGLHHGRLQHLRPAHDHDRRLGRRPPTSAGRSPTPRPFSGADGPVTGHGRFLHLHADRSHRRRLPEGAGTQVDLGACRTIAAGVAPVRAYTVGLTAAAAGTYCWRAEYTPDAESSTSQGRTRTTTTECFTSTRPRSTSRRPPTRPDRSTPAIRSASTSPSPTPARARPSTSRSTDTASRAASSGRSARSPAGTRPASPARSRPSEPGVLTCTDASLPAGGSVPSASRARPTPPTAARSTTPPASRPATTAPTQATATVVVHCPDITVTKTPDGGHGQRRRARPRARSVENIGAGHCDRRRPHRRAPGGHRLERGQRRLRDHRRRRHRGPDLHVGDPAPPVASQDVHGHRHDRRRRLRPDQQHRLGRRHQRAGTGRQQLRPGLDHGACAQIDIVKDANPVGPVSAGDDIGFDITVTNSGNGAATDVHVSDNAARRHHLDGRPADRRHADGVVCAIARRTTSSATTRRWPAGDSFTVHVHGVTDAADCGTDQQHRHGHDRQRRRRPPTAPRRRPVPRRHRPEDGRQQPDPSGRHGGLHDHRQQRRRRRRRRAVHVVDVLPGGIAWAIDPAVAGCAIVGSTLTCDFATLAAGAAPIVIHVSGTTDNGDCGDASEPGQVSAGNEPDGATDNNSSRGDHRRRVRRRLRREDGRRRRRQISAGDTAAFTITVTNNGPDTAVNVVVDDTLPAGVNWVLSIVTLNGESDPQPVRRDRRRRAPLRPRRPGARRRGRHPHRRRHGLRGLRHAHQHRRDRLGQRARGR